MALNADALLERIHLVNQARRWRIAALVVLTVAVFLLFEKYSPLDSASISGDHVARYRLTEMIMGDPDRHELLKEIAEDDSIKALIVEIDSPGGTTVASEQVYLDLRAIAKKKPVVSVMETIATSGAYMAAIATDQIFARRGTITASIGVIMQTAELTGLAESIGVKPIILRSGDLKATPNPMESMTPKTREMLGGLIDDFFGFFIDLVQERRGLTPEQRAVIADGRVVSANQALELNLIDAIGGEEEARDWLKQEHKISKDLKLREYEVYEEENPFESFFRSQFGLSWFDNVSVPLDGLLAIWHPSVSH